MTKRDRYMQVMRQDYPKDFIPDDEWDFIEAMASAGKQSNQKRGGDKRMEVNMAKQQLTVQVQHTNAQKIDYFKNRVNDRNLTQSQRNYAQQRLNALCGTSTVNRNTSKPIQQYTDAQKYAYGAGIGYATAKKGQQVKIKDENKDSFRKGYKRVK